MAQELVQKPHIASGIRFVHVDMAYRPYKLTQPYTYALYLEQYLGEVRNRLDTFEFAQEFNGSPQDLAQVRKHWRCLKVAQQSLKFPFRVPTRLLEKNPEKNPDLNKEEAELVNEFRQLILRCHAEYCEKQKEQRLLLSTNSFSNALAAAISNFPQATTLCLTDEYSSVSDSIRGHMKDEKKFVSKDGIGALLRHVNHPIPWTEIHERDHGMLELVPDLLAAKMLWELPIAIHKAAPGHLQNLNIKCFPPGNELITGDFGDFSLSDLQDLRSVGQNLKTLAFDCTHYGYSNPESRMDEKWLTEAAESVVDSYLGSLLSGGLNSPGKMEHVVLDGRVFLGELSCWNPGGLFKYILAGAEDSTHVDQRECATAWKSRLETWSMQNFYIEQKTMEGFAAWMLKTRRASNSLKEAKFGSIILDDGRTDFTSGYDPEKVSWEKAVRILDQVSQFPDCVVEMEQFMGGKYRWIRIDMMDGDAMDSESSSGDEMELDE